MPVTFNTVCDRRPRRTAVEILFHVSDGRRMRNECITLVDGKYKIIITSSFSPSCHYHLISSGLLKWQLLSANSPQVFLVFPSFFPYALWPVMPVNFVVYKTKFCGLCHLPTESMMLFLFLHVHLMMMIHIGRARSAGTYVAGGWCR